LIAHSDRMRLSSSGSPVRSRAKFRTSVARIPWPKRFTGLPCTACTASWIPRSLAVSWWNVIMRSAISVHIRSDTAPSGIITQPPARARSSRDCQRSTTLLLLNHVGEAHGLLLHVAHHRVGAAREKHVQEHGRNRDAQTPLGGDQRFRDTA